MPRGPSFTPFTAGGRRSISAILLTLALSATVGVLLSIVSTAKSQHRAAVLEVAGRQRSLAERYVNGTWSTFKPPNATAFDNELESVAAISATNVWAVGYAAKDAFGNSRKPLIEHFRC